MNSGIDFSSVINNIKNCGPDQQLTTDLTPIEKQNTFSPINWLSWTVNRIKVGLGLQDQNSSTNAKDVVQQIVLFLESHKREVATHREEVHEALKNAKQILGPSQETAIDLIDSWVNQVVLPWQDYNGAVPSSKEEAELLSPQFVSMREAADRDGNQLALRLLESCAPLQETIQNRLSGDLNAHFQLGMHWYFARDLNQAREHFIRAVRNTGLSPSEIFRFEAGLAQVKQQFDQEWFKKIYQELEPEIGNTQ